MFMCDHVGVEIAQEAHGALLESHGLLDPAQRLLGKCPTPDCKTVDGLIIDDYFVLHKCSPAELLLPPREARGPDVEKMQIAAQAYSSENIAGSPEKDVLVLAAALGTVVGDEVDSGPGLA